MTSRLTPPLLPLGLIAILAAACGGPATGSSGPAADAGLAPDDGGCAFLAPVVAAPQALIVTAEALAPTFARYARLHTLTGIPTEVVTIEALCAGGCDDGDPTRDRARRIKEHLRQQAGLKYVLLGGDLDVVPSRLVHDQYQNPMMPSYSFVADFHTDFYYADLSEWDANGDGAYAQDGVDAPAYGADLAVARVPVSTVAEAEDYLAKVVHHLTAFDAASATRAAFFTNISFSFLGMDFDSAYYLEAAGRTGSLLPAGFTVEKRYAQPDLSPGAQANTPQAEAAVFAQGASFIVHSGHAGVEAVTTEADGSNALTGAMAYALTNATLPIFLSCGCEAGDFAYGAAVTDAAGELLLRAPAGGAVAYLGNVPVGLGIAGGMQIIDELLRYVQDHPTPLLADAYLAAHANLPASDSFVLPLVGLAVPVINRDSYEWTKKAAVLLGDHLIPVWTAGRPPAPALSATQQPACGGSRVTFSFAQPALGTVRFAAGGAVYEVDVAGPSVTIHLATSPPAVAAGLASAASQYGYWELGL